MVKLTKKNGFGPGPPRKEFASMVRAPERTKVPGPILLAKVVLREPIANNDVLNWRFQLA